MVIYEGSYSYGKYRNVQKKTKNIFGKGKINWGIKQYTELEAKEKYNLDSFQDCQVKTQVNIHKEGVVFTTLDSTFDKYGLMNSSALTLRTEGYYYDEVENIEITPAGVEKREGSLFWNMLGYGIIMVLLSILFLTDKSAHIFYIFVVGTIIGLAVSFRKVTINYQAIVFNFSDGNKRSLVIDQSYLAYYIKEFREVFNDKLVIDNNYGFEGGNNDTID